MFFTHSLLFNVYNLLLCALFIYNITSVEPTRIMVSFCFEIEDVVDVWHLCDDIDFIMSFNRSFDARKSR